MLPHYVGKYEHIQNINDFESAKIVLMKEDYKMIVKRRFESIYNMMLDFESYSKNEDKPENKEIFLYSFKPVQTNKVDNYILIGYESNELHENDKLFNIWSNK